VPRKTVRKKPILKKDGTPRKKRNYSAARVRSKVAEAEQERIRSKLASLYLPQIAREKGGAIKDQYTPEIATELCIMRRAGMSTRKIQDECHISVATIKRWQSEYPEFSQEWQACYSDYILDTAEELVPRAEALMEGLRIDGKKLSPKQEGRYQRAFERLSQEVHWAATRRVPEIYGDREDGNQLVIVQALDIPRSVSQYPEGALAYRKEIEDAKARSQDSLRPDGTGGEVSRLSDNAGAGGGEVQGDDERTHVVRRYKRGGRPLVKPSK
jgi:hypothetical protein